jgi:hypothetical protein
MRDVTDDVHLDIIGYQLGLPLDYQLGFHGRVTLIMMLEGCMDSSRKQRLPASTAPAAIHSTCECVL